MIKKVIYSLVFIVSVFLVIKGNAIHGYKGLFTCRVIFIQ